MGHYYYTVHDENGNAVMSLIMMDSNMYPDESLGVEGYDKFHDDQVQWYKDTIKKIALEENGDETKVVPSLAFSIFRFMSSLRLIMRQRKREKSSPAGVLKRNTAPMRMTECSRQWSKWAAQRVYL